MLTEYDFQENQHSHVFQYNRKFTTIDHLLDFKASHNEFKKAQVIQNIFYDNNEINLEITNFNFTRSLCF